MPLALDQPLETTPLDHPQETQATIVLNADKRAIMPGIAHAVAVKDKPKRTSSISMRNTTTMKGLKPLLV